MTKEEYTKERALRVVTLCSGYDSQCMALERLKRDFPGFDYDCIAWAEIDRYAIQAHDAVFPQYRDRNMGDITSCDWTKVAQPVDLLVYSTPCFPSGTLVLTDDGYKPIEDICENDLVLTHANRFMRVVKPMSRKYCGSVYSLTSPIFNDLTCTENHPLYVRRMYRTGHKAVRTFGEPEWMSPSQMMSDLVSDRKPSTKRYYIGYAVNREERIPEWDGSIDNRWGHHRRINKFAGCLDKPDFWYVMGRYVGDGWKRESNFGSSVIICCGGRKEDELKEALDRLGWHFNVSEERAVRKYHIHMNELYDFVGRYGYYAHGKKIDAETMCLPAELLRPFVGGLIDSDGHVADGIYRISSVSPVLIYGLGQCVAKAYHRPFSIYKTLRPEKTMIEGRLVSQRDSWTISWKMQTDIQDKSFYEDGYVWAPINRLEWQGKRCEVYNMEVEEDSSYTANGAIAHNCTSISNAGKQEGLKRGSGTASSIIWSVLNAIDVLKPKYLLMENVKALVSKKFMPDFREWYNELESRGYQNFWKVLNAKDYCVPQNRERVFMVSILDGDASFHFPEPFPLERRLKDILEEDIDERYYLSDKCVKGFMEHNRRHQEKGTGFLCRPKTGEDIANALRANGAICPTDNMIYRPVIYDDYNSRVAEDQSVMGTVTPNCGTSAPRNGYKIIEPVIAALRGRNSQNPSDRTAGCPTEQRLEIGEDISNTVTTVEKDCLVVMPICLNPKVDGRQPSLEHRVYDCGGISTAVTTGFMPKIAVPAVLTPKRNEYGKAVRRKYEAGEIDESRHNMTDLFPREDGICNTITSVQKDCLLIEPVSSKSVAEAARKEKIEVAIDGEGNLRPHRMDKKKSGCSEFQTENESSIASTCISARPNMTYGESTSFRIRKLSEREVFRLMDVSEEDIDRIQKAGISRSRQYALAGNSIVVNVLYHLFRKLLIEPECESKQLSLF